MATYYKEIAKKLASEKTVILIKDNGTIVQRQVTGTFASRHGKSSYWGVTFNEPIDDNCQGVVCSFIIDILPQKNLDQIIDDLTK